MVDGVDLENRINPMAVLVELWVTLRARFPKGRQQPKTGLVAMVKMGKRGLQSVTLELSRRTGGRGAALWCSSKRPCGFSDGGRAFGWLGMVVCVLLDWESWKCCDLLPAMATALDIKVSVNTTAAGHVLEA
jgi:hypothetical protein